MEDKLRRELQQLSPAQLRELLNASGHGQLLADEKPAVDEQLVAETKNEGNAFFRQGRLHDAVSSYSRSLRCRSASHTLIYSATKTVIYFPNDDQADDGLKPFMRRATAFIALSITDLTAALELEPRNKECCAKLQAIQRGNGANAELRRAGVRAAAIFSVREGWSKSAVRGNPGPAAVNGHTLFRGDNGRIYLFGGRAVREQKPDVFVLDESDNSSWDTVPTLGTGVPSSRAWHSTSAIGNEGSEFYCVYGGVSSRGEDSSVHLLVPASPRGFQWIQPHCSQDLKEIPAPRSGHAVVSIVEDNGDRIVFMFGGRTKRGVSDQLLILRLSTIRTGSNAHDSVDATVAWEEVGPEAGSAWPSARDGHSMCLIPSTGNRTPRLIVFGGNGQLNDDRMNDVWLFDVEKQLWTLLQCSGDIPPPRSYHTAHTVGEFLFVVGGRTAESEDGSVYMLDIGATEWFKVPIPSDHTLPPRAWHSSVLTKAGELFVLGGGTYHGPLKDAATLDLSYFHLKAPSLMQ
ncbi:Kelch-type beta propeller [Phytophthora cactorum]|nr:Kelch-type beta propeller [Phytophthora cactorum]